MATPSRTSSRTRSGDFQLSKSASSSAPRMKTASCRASLLERVDGACVRIELDGSFGNVREREPRELEPRVGGGRRALVPGICDDEDEELVEPELSDRRASEGDDGRGAEDRRRRRGCLLPLERLLADLDLRRRA